VGSSRKARVKDPNDVPVRSFKAIGKGEDDVFPAIVAHGVDLAVQDAGRIIKTPRHRQAGIPLRCIRANIEENKKNHKG